MFEGCIFREDKGSFFLFSADKRLYEYIHNHTEEAFCDAVFFEPEEKNTYILIILLFFKTIIIR